MKEPNIILLPEKVTANNLDTCLVISSIAYQSTTGKMAIGIHKAMKTKESTKKGEESKPALLYGEAFKGNINITLADLDPTDPALKGLFDLIHKAFKNWDQKDDSDKSPVSAKDL